MSAPETTTAQATIGISVSRLMVGLGLSVLAGGLFSYIIDDITAHQYLLEFMTLMLVEAPFVALFALLARKIGWQTAAGCAVAAFVGSAALFLPEISLTPVIFLKLPIMGILIGTPHLFDRSFFSRLTASAAPGLVIAFVLGGLVLISGMSPELENTIRTDTLDVYLAFMEPDDAQNAADNAMLFFESMFSISVAFLVLFTVVETWLAFMLANWLFVRFREHPEVLPPSQYYRLPFHAVWLFLAGGLIAVLEVSALAPVALNLLAITGGLYAIQGLAIAMYFLNRSPLGRLPKIVFWVIFFLTISFTGFLLIIAGILDNWFNFRSLPGTPGHAQEGRTNESYSSREHHE